MHFNGPKQTNMKQSRSYSGLGLVLDVVNGVENMPLNFEAKKIREKQTAKRKAVLGNIATAGKIESEEDICAIINELKSSLPVRKHSNEYGGDVTKTNTPFSSSSIQNAPLPHCPRSLPNWPLNVASRHSPRQQKSLKYSSQLNRERLKECGVNLRDYNVCTNAEGAGLGYRRANIDLPELKDKNGEQWFGSAQLRDKLQRQRDRNEIEQKEKIEALKRREQQLIEEMLKRKQLEEEKKQKQNEESETSPSDGAISG
eukprot:TRINITY_DN885_c0_g1_i2.p1 TRINITY_DN885_c0_g1~~TRINITY_DN885_c0_g1_i2.p1  ORF type:complete len:257 (+),score=66.82 TRINITY_DN885_c0_g1_i2:146-916(+)